MAKFRSIKNSLIAGELSPTALGRTDLPIYPHACKTLRNMIPFMSGGAYRRPGSFWAKEYIGSTDFAPRVIPFVVSKTEVYAVLINQTLSGITNQISILNPYSNTALPAAATVTGTLPYDGNVGSHPSATGSFYDDWHEAQYVQSADVLFLVHPLYKPQRISRTSASNFTVTEFDNGLSGTALRDAYPYRPQNTTSATMAPSHTSGSGRTLTSSVAFFDTGHIGAIFKINHSGTIGACKVTAVALGGLTATVDIIVNFGATTAQAAWWESAWSDYRGWPRSIAFYQQRLVYGGNDGSPDSIWCSETSNYDVMSVAATADPRSDGTGDDPFTIELSSQQLNLIQWLSAEKTLLVGTQGDEWIIDFNPTTTVPGFATETATAIVQSHYGSSFNQAARIGNELIFCGAGEDELRSLVFNDIEKSYVDEPIQTFYDEFPKTEPTGSYLGNRKIRTFAWDETRKTLWAVDTAGNLVGMTRDRRAGIVLWHSHQMGGYDSTRVGAAIDVTGSSDYTRDPAYEVCAGSVISLAIIPNQFIGTNDIWLVVKRYINGAWKFHVERIIGKSYPYATAYAIPVVSGSSFADASRYLTNSDITAGVVSNKFDHLEGEELVGTAYHTDGIFELSGSAVSTGDTTIDQYGSVTLSQVVMGLSYDSIVEPVRVEAGSQIGTSQGAIKRIHKATTRFYRTMSAKVGVDADNLEEIDFRDPDTAMAKSQELFTGDKAIEIEDEYGTDGYLYILQDKPLPFAVTSMVAEGLTYDG